MGGGGDEHAISGWKFVRNVEGAGGQEGRCSQA